MERWGPDRVGRLEGRHESIAGLNWGVDSHAWGVTWLWMTEPQPQPHPMHASQSHTRRPSPIIRSRSIADEMRCSASLSVSACCCCELRGCEFPPESPELLRSSPAAGVDLDRVCTVAGSRSAGQVDIARECVCVLRRSVGLVWPAPSVPRSITSITRLASSSPPLTSPYTHTPTPNPQPTPAPWQTWWWTAAPRRARTRRRPWCAWRTPWGRR